MIQQWRVIPETSGRYEVSRSGSLRRSSWYQESRKGGTLKRYLQPHVGTNGYRMARLVLGNGRELRVPVGNLVLLALVGPKAGSSRKFQMRHLNGDRIDDRLSNLRWGTAAENYQDKIRHGTDQKGERHGMTKLTEQDVIEIRASKETHVALARKFQVSAPGIVNIRKGIIWGWLKQPEAVR